MLDNNNDVVTDFKPFLSIYILPHTFVGMTSCFSSVFSIYSAECSLVSS